MSSKRYPVIGRRVRRMDIENKIVETLQEANSLLYLLEADLSVQLQERTYIDTVRVVRNLLKSILDSMN